MHATTASYTHHSWLLSSHTNDGALCKTTYRANGVDRTSSQNGRCLAPGSIIGVNQDVQTGQNSDWAIAEVGAVVLMMVHAWVGGH